MRRDDYWNLFWASGMPEAWVLSRNLEGSHLPPRVTGRDLPRAHAELPEEARRLEQKKAEELG